MTVQAHLEAVRDYIEESDVAMSTVSRYEAREALSSLAAELERLEKATRTRDDYNIRERDEAKRDALKYGGAEWMGREGASWSDR